jgi:UDP-N-acetylglucosamine--N-acetylmuramyl-(pentapeptide) pyrophosphoryl-undecaprenol N-acetylglucosamine transferase
MPALAVAEALRERGAEVTFTVAKGAGGRGLAEREGYEEDTLPLRGFDRRPSFRNLRTLWQTALAVPRALAILRRRKPEVVVGAGGYLAGPMAIAAWLSRRPVVLMEADSRLGAANRLAAPFAKRVTLAFPLAGRGSKRYVVTGRPVRKSVRDATRVSGRSALGIPSEETAVLVFGGSQGARTLNDAAVDAFGPEPPFLLIHVAGERNLDEVRGRLGHEGGDSRYRLEGFTHDLPDALAAADLVVARSGGSVFEIAAMGRPSILVPYPHATADHQTVNAQWMAEAGAALVLPDDECNGPRLREVVGALLADRGRLEAMGAAASAISRPDAAERIADEVEGAARRRKPPKKPRLRHLRGAVRRTGRAGRRVGSVRIRRPRRFRAPRIRFPRLRLRRRK